MFYYAPEKEVLAESEFRSRLLNDFEERVGKLESLSDSRLKALASSFDIQTINLYPEKFTPAILWRVGENFEILLSSRTESGYKQMEHVDIISNEYGLSWDSKNQFLSFLVISNNERFLISINLEYLDKQGQNNLIEALVKYKIKAAFSVDRKVGTNNLIYNLEKRILSGDFSPFIDKLLFDEWTNQC